MLRELSVHNLALIEDVRVELEPGFCAWTGETGAGKTLLLEALGLLLGERGSAELLRTGAAELRVTARFELADADLRQRIDQLLTSPLEDDQLIITRRLGQGGRSYAYVNEQPVAVGTLRQLGTLLVDIHGQRESQSLLQPAYQLELLDAFGDLHAPRAAYVDAAAEVRQRRQQLHALTAQRQERQRDLALLRFERDELDEAKPVAGELPALAAERLRLANAQALQTFAAAGCARLHDDDASIVDSLARLLREAQHWQASDPQLDDVAKGLSSSIEQVRDVTERLRDLGDRWEANPERLEEVEERLRLLRRLETKYGRPLDELAAYRATLDDREKQLQQQESDLEEVQAQLSAAFAALQKAAQELSKRRQKVAGKLAAAVQKHLADLGMPDAILAVTLTPVPLSDDPLTADVPAGGIDQCELTLAANCGEPARPLRKVASGGELSRTMLALKTVLAAHDRVPTLIFDEIDANVGGRLGDVLGQKLAALGQSRQIICVTHLPQVASYAGRQWTIRKQRQGQRTATTIEPLTEEERVEELASMLRGEARSATTRVEAAAMLTAAKKRTLKRAKEA